MAAWLICIAALFLLQLLSRSIHRFWGYRFPWRISSAAILAWALGATFPMSGGFGLADDLVVALAITRVLLWFGLELLPRWRLLPHSPKILRDLLFVLISGLLVVITLQQRAKVDLLGIVTTSAVLTAIIGLANTSDYATVPEFPGFPASGSYGYYGADGTYRHDGNTTTTYGATYANGDVIGVALDLTSNTLTMYKNN
ncbi:MAG: hypothetical protein EB123_05000, partial [Synechococcaceae bacterium WBB_32_011]|nr:hypothetical protein [Synechococcaceae bacterium WBB_32_011]